MKQLHEYITESIFDIDDEQIANKTGLVCPKTKHELIQLIHNAINEQQPNEGDTIDLNFIDTSKITDMSSVFGFSHGIKWELYNYDVSEWDVSNVISMSQMFYRCENFDCDLSKWRPVKCDDFYGTFYGCINFTGKGLEKWDPHKMFASNMFFNCHKLNCDLSSWTNVIINDDRTLGCNYMFYNCKHFNSELKNWTIKTRSTKCMFAGCNKFEGHGLDTWTIKSGLQVAQSMFQSAENLYFDISNWKIFENCRIENIFYGCKKMNKDMIKFKQ